MRRRVTRRGGSGALLSLLFVLEIGLLAASPDPVHEFLRTKIEERVQNGLDAAYLRQKSGRSTGFDRLAVRGMVRFGRVAFAWISPEAVQILKHYVAGSGKELLLDPVYIQNSPVIRRALPDGRRGAVGPVAFRQDEDYRLSLAFNPFFVSVDTEAGQRWCTVFNGIAFEAPREQKNVRTRLRLGEWRVLFPDSLVHLACEDDRCPAFVAKARFKC